MIRKYADKQFFLWNYAIDKNFQNKGLGERALKKFILFLKDEFDIEVMTTTYTWGNEKAKHLYEKIGFVESSVVDEEDCHEVNMTYEITK